MITECGQVQADQAWVRVAGMTGQVLFEGEPVVDVLDRAVPDRPLIVLDDLGHAVFANHLGLAAAGITEDSVDPGGGVYTRDPQTGLLSGGLLESAQQQLRDAATVDAETLVDGLRVSLAELARNGITTISDAGGYWTRDHDLAWAQLEADGLLTVRAHNALYLYPDRELDAQLAEFERRFRDTPAGLLRWNTVKIYIDGILSLGTARVLAPYAPPIDPAYPNGFAYFDAPRLHAYVAALTEMGFRLHFHAVGDAAVRTALDVIDDAAVAPASGKHRLTHTYLIHPDDVPRFAQSDVVVDFQVGVESGSEATVADFSTFLGARAERLLPVRAMIDAGAHVVLSSDWDADELSPIGIIARSVGRARQAVPDAYTAVRMLTIDAARALGHAEQLGSIEVGKRADLAVIEGDLLDGSAAERRNARVVMTLFDGEVLFDAR